jgi:hypothetical protein
MAVPGKNLFNYTIPAFLEGLPGFGNIAQAAAKLSGLSSQMAAQDLASAQLQVGTAVNPTLHHDQIGAHYGNKKTSYRKAKTSRIRRQTGAGRGKGRKA